MNFKRYTSKEIKKLISFAFIKSGLLSNPMVIRKGKFHEKEITSENSDYLANVEGKKLKILKLKLSDIEKCPGKYDKEEDKGDDNNDYICTKI